jgi:hypothetical protein
MTFEVKYQTTASSGIATTTENGKNVSEIREKMKKRIKNLAKIISIKPR